MSNYIYAANVICRAGSVAIGNALAAAIDPDTGGAETFTKGLPCYQEGTTFSGIGPARRASTDPSHYASFPLLTASGYALMSEFAGTGPYLLLNAIGIDNATIAVAKNVIVLECGPRVEYEHSGVAFVHAQGLLTK